MRRCTTSCAASLARAGTRTLTTWRLAHRWVKLTDWTRTSTKLAVREGTHGAPNNPHKTPSQIALLALCCKNSSAARARLHSLVAHDIFHGGEARRKRLQLRTRSTKTRSSPRRFWKSRSRSSILHGAPVRQLAMHWPGDWGAVAFAAAPLFKRGVA
jgi:hypothetical protein